MLPLERILLSAIPVNVQHRTWLGSARAASCGIGAERRQWRKQRGGDRDSKGALARLLGSPDRNIVRGQRPGALSDKHLLASDEVWGFFHIQTTLTYCLVISANVQHCTWLARSRARPVGSELSATSGTEACRDQQWKQPGGSSEAEIGILQERMRDY